jgi:hypothetical protein
VIDVFPERTIFWSFSSCFSLAVLLTLLSTNDREAVLFSLLWFEVSWRKKWSDILVLAKRRIRNSSSSLRRIVSLSKFRERDQKEGPHHNREIKYLLYISLAAQSEILVSDRSNFLSVLRPVTKRMKNSKFIWAWIHVFKCFDDEKLHVGICLYLQCIWFHN